MRFDDRLMTVLAQPSDDPHDCAVRWRQLVDLLARAGRSPQGPLIDQALEALRTDWHRVAEPLRAAAARAVADRTLPVALIAAFAADGLAVSAPVLAAARLNAAEWQQVLANATAETRQFVASLNSELQPKPGRPELDRSPTPAAEPSPRPQPVPSISDVLARIERLRRQRERERVAGDKPARQFAAGGSPALFRWECGPTGEIQWVEGAPRGPLIGRSIARGDEGEGVDRQVERAFDMRAPFRDATLTLAGEGSVAGQWKISGVPAFDPTQGRFAGYRGVAMRPSIDGAAETEAGRGRGSEPLDAASLRELVHEIRTPLNAIIGFAEIIDGQLLGPADHQYRSRAFEIVRQAKLLLSAIEDLDFVARAQSAETGERSPIHLGQMVEGMTASLREMASSHGAALGVSVAGGDVFVATDPELAKRLIVRLCSGVTGHAQRGEQLHLRVDDLRDACGVSITKPAAIRDIGEDELIGSADEDSGAAFALRLLRGLARIAEVELEISGESVALLFPRA